MPSLNEMSHFAVNPEVRIERSRMDLDQNIKFTGNAAELIPFYACEVLPGDSFDVSQTMVCRLQTPIHPLMDSLYADVNYWFVPYRLIWDNFKHFMGEPDQAWLPSRDYTVPQCKVKVFVASDYTDSTQKTAADSSWSYFKNSFWDYIGLGYVVEDKSQVASHPGGQILNISHISALPLRSYLKIYDDWWRDENLQNPLNIYTGDNDVNCIFYPGQGETVSNDVLVGSKLLKVNKLHDYFTSALPGPQRSATGVTLTTGVNMPVNTGSTNQGYKSSLPSIHFAGASDYSNSIGMSNIVDAGGNTRAAFIATTPGYLQIDNLYTLAGSSLGITINDLRLAFQLQRFYEKSARYGARYIELVHGMFGVESPDARLQRSEYLGGYRVPINITQVVNQAEQNNIPLGNTGAVSLTVDVDHDVFNHSFTEHGICIGTICIRYKHSYNQGTPAWLTRSTKFDYYWPCFQSLGEMPIRQQEIFNGPGSYNNTFGFQEAWASYRYLPDRVCAEMRPGVSDSLASWNLADYYDSVPTLSSSWIQEDISPIDRAISVTSTVSNQFLFDVLVKNKATRPMPIYSIPGLADHF